MEKATINGNLPRVCSHCPYFHSAYNEDSQDMDFTCDLIGKIVMLCPSFTRYEWCVLEEKKDVE